MLRRIHPHPHRRTSHAPACKGQGKALANFDYSGWLTESNHLGNVAFRVGKKLEWDPVTMRAKNAPAADQYLQREYRKGWAL